MIEEVASCSSLVLEDGCVHECGCSDHSLVDAVVVESEVDGLVLGQLEGSAGAIRSASVLADIEP